MATTKVNSEFIAVNAISGTIIADGAITSTHLAANCVDSSELVTGSIDTIHIAANQVTATKIVTNGVLTRHISDDQVTGDKIASATIVSGNIANNAILTQHIDDNQINIDQLNVSDGSSGQVLQTNGSGTLSFATVSGTTINNNADNRIITGSGTANTLNGEANLTFNSSLVITKSEGAANSLNDQISLEHTSGTTGYHIKTIRAAANDNPDGIAFVENTTERMRIRSGNIGMGTTNPDAPLHIEATNASMLLSNSGRTQYWRIQNNESADAFTINASDVNERFRIDSSGSITAPNQPSFMCFPNAYTHSAGATQKTFENESFDKGSNYNTSNGRFTAPVAGRYMFLCEVAAYTSSTALTYLGIGVRKNGSGSVYWGGWESKHAGSYGKSSSTVILELAASDYIEVYIETSATHGIYGAEGGQNTRWSGQLLS